MSKRTSRTKSHADTSTSHNLLPQNGNAQAVSMLDDVELRRRRALQRNPHGLTFEQAMEAFAAYFSCDGKAELHCVIEREYARDFYGDIPPLADVSNDLYARYEELASQARLMCQPQHEPVEPLPVCPFVID